MRILLFFSLILTDPHCLGGQTPEVIHYFDSLGTLYYEQGRYGEAIPLLDSAQARLLRKVESGETAARERLFAVMDRLNLSLQRTRGFEHALAVYERSRPVYDVLWTTFPKDSAVAYHVTHLYLGLSWFALLTGRPAETIRHCRYALQLDPNFLSAYTNLALGYLARGQFSKAKKIYRRFQNTNLVLPVSGAVSMREVFLQDLDYLESLGISLPGVERARAILGKNR